MRISSSLALALTGCSDTMSGHSADSAKDSAEPRERAAETRQVSQMPATEPPPEDSSEEPASAEEPEATPEAPPKASNSGAADSKPMAQSAAAPRGADDSQPMAAVDWESDCEVRPIFRAHGKTVSGDETPYEIAPESEAVPQFIFTPTWQGEMHMLAARPIEGNARAVHHWGLYTLHDASVRDGEILSRDSLIDALRITSAQLLVGAGPGASPLVMPPGVGAVLPTGAGAGYLLEIHYFSVGTDQTEFDQTGIELCLTSKPVQNEAAIHVLGRLTFSLPPHARTEVMTTCRPENMTQPVHLMAVTPHMHATAVHGKLVLQRASGEQVVVLDQPYQSKEQRTYMLPDILVHDGDTLVTTCSFENTSDRAVNQGPDAADEMCYMMLWTWPAGLLQNSQPLGVNVAVPEDRDCLER